MIQGCPTLKGVKITLNRYCTSICNDLSCYIGCSIVVATITPNMLHVDAPMSRVAVAILGYEYINKLLKPFFFKLGKEDCPKPKPCWIFAALATDSLTVD